MSDEKNTKKDDFTVNDRRGEAKAQPAKPEVKEEKTPPPPRKIDFSTFVISMSTSALVHMGLVEDPITNKKEKQVERARHDIDLIEMLAEKTKGNLTPPEKQLVEQVLYELRVRFVESTR